MNKLTAVEWYAEQAMKLEILRAKGTISVSELLLQLTNVVKQAKAMEKKQMALCYKADRLTTNFKFEQYYNIAFK